MRKSTLDIMAKANEVIEDIKKINNDNYCNMEIKITDQFGRNIEFGDHYCLNIEIQFNENSIPKILSDKKLEILEVLEKHKCGKCALNIYEKGSHIEFMVSINGYDQFDNIEVTCPGINNEILSIGKKYHIFDLRGYNFDNYFKYETLIDIKKVENSTEYEFYFENIDKPFKTFTRGNVNDSSKIMHRFDYILFDQFKGNFLQNILKLTINQICILETKESIKENAKYYDIINKILELRKEFNL